MNIFALFAAMRGPPSTNIIISPVSHEVLFALPEPSPRPARADVLVVEYLLGRPVLPVDVRERLVPVGSQPGEDRARAEVLQDVLGLPPSSSLLPFPPLLPLWFRQAPLLKLVRQLASRVNPFFSCIFSRPTSFEHLLMASTTEHPSPSLHTSK